MFGAVGRDRLGWCAGPGAGVIPLPAVLVRQPGRGRRVFDRWSFL